MKRMTPAKNMRTKTTRKKLSKFLATPKFGRFFLVGSIVILAVSTVFWSILSAHLQQSNADQLVDNYFFESARTFQATKFPGAHTFLLKWPLFWLISLVGSTPLSITITTVLLPFLVIGFLAFIMCRIERRPLVLGTLYLLLTTVLLLVPAQPYAGALLPVNMAMLTTRNIEYVVYILALLFVAKAKRYLSWTFVAAVSLLALVTASDKLFLSLACGAALLALVVYSYAQKWRYVTLASRLLFASIAAAAIGELLLVMLNAGHVTHIVSEGGVSPYGVVSGGKTIITAGIYAGMGLLTNLGANPAFDAVAISQIPSHLLHTILSLRGPLFVINIVFSALALLIVSKLFIVSFKQKKPRFLVHDEWNSLSVLLVWSSAVAVGVFVASNHYYAVDARYLAICMFTVFISLATYVRKIKWKPQQLAGLSLLLILGMCIAVPGLLAAQRQAEAVLDPYQQRDAAVLQALSQHRSTTLVGDYWRIMPIKSHQPSRLTAVPLADCTHFRQVLASGAWQGAARSRNVAYLLSLDKGLTDFPACSLATVTAQFGYPDDSVITAGSANKPTEILLFYNHGLRKKPAPDVQNITLSLAKSVSGLNALDAKCDKQTIMQVVAHEDDDLLFMNPDLGHDIRAGNCIRTVYLTAGDSGQNEEYWRHREQGSEAAYAEMLGIPDLWTQTTVQLENHRAIRVSSPRASRNVSLIFMNLPDGNITGKGFKSSGHESLSQLIAGVIPRIHNLEHDASYTTDGVVATLSTLMKHYAPSEVRAQSQYVSDVFPDHSDHIATSTLTDRAYAAYAASKAGLAESPAHYMGYPVRELDANINSEDLDQKQATFFTYGAYDNAVCSTINSCTHTETYSAYLPREYRE
jgi:LmbE family N-acetylglucosaminyl deacetylase